MAQVLVDGTYVLTHTDPTKTDIIIKAYTANGRVAPSPSDPLCVLVPALDSRSIAEDSPLLLIGKGFADYGAEVQENMLHILENFSNACAPVKPVQGQLWYKNDSSELFVCVNAVGPVWEMVLTAGAAVMASDLDMNGFKIINLGAPTPGSTDAATALYAETYADAAVTTHAGDFSLHLTPNQNTLLDGLNLPTLTSTEVNYLIGVTSSIQTQLNDKVLRAGDTMTGFLFLAPSYPFTGSSEAATKGYVDGVELDDLANVVVPAPIVGDYLGFNGVNWVNLPAVVVPSDRYVVSGAMSGNTLVLTMSTALPTPTVDITGVAPIGHIHSTSDIEHDLNPNYDSSYLRDQFVGEPGYPQDTSFDNAVAAIDQAVYATRSPYKRRILQSDGTVGPYDTPEYDTYTNKLTVYVNGVKYYASTRGTATLIIDGGPGPSSSANSGTDTGLDGTGGTTYDFDLRVDTTGAAVTISVTPTNIPVDLDIVAVNTGLDTFTVTGNYITSFPTGKTFSVSGSTGNDGVYTVLAPGATMSGSQTVIPVLVVPSAVNDGIITVDQVTFDNLVDEINIEILLSALAGQVAAVFRDSAILFVPASQGNTSLVELIDGSGTDPLIAALTTTFTLTEILYDSYGSFVDIDAADATLDTFSVLGDYTVAFPTGTLFIVNGSASNDGAYVVIAPGATFGAGVTTIPVTAATVTLTEASPTGTGEIYFARSLGYDENGDPYGISYGGPVNPGNNITFTTAPTATALIEVNVVP